MTFRRRQQMLTIAVLLAVAAGAGRRGHAGALAEPPAAGPVSDAHLKRLVTVGLVTLPAEPAAAAAGKVKSWVSATLRQALARQPGILLVPGQPPGGAQFRVDVELARAGHVHTGGGWAAGAALYVHLIDVATGVEVARERFTAVRAASGAGGDVLGRLGQAGGPGTPLAAAAASALDQAAAYLAGQIRSRFWQVRAVAVRQGASVNAFTGRAGQHQLITLSAGADAGLKPNDSLYLRRYGAPIEGLDGTSIGRHVDPLVDIPLFVDRVDKTSAVAWGPLSMQPMPGDVIRWGAVLPHRAIIGTFKTNPPDARRRGDRALDVVAGQVQEAVTGMAEYFEREQLQAPPNSLVCTGEVERTGTPGEVKITVTVQDKRPGKETQTVSRTGAQELQTSIVNQIWLELQDRIQGQAATPPAIDPNKLAQVDPGRVELVASIPSVHFQQERPDFHVRLQLDRGEGSSYRYGESVRMTVQSPDSDCYVQIWYVNNANRSYQVFPRDPKHAGNDPIRNDPEAGLLHKGEIRQLPPPGIDYPVGPPAGEDYLVVLAVKGRKGKQLYPYMAGLMQREYPPQEAADARDVRLPPPAKGKASSGKEDRAPAAPRSRLPNPPSIRMPNPPRLQVSGSDQIRAPDLTQIASLPRARGLRVTEALQQAEHDNDVKPASSSVNNDPLNGWEEASLWASNVTWWRTVDPNARFSQAVPARDRLAVAARPAAAGRQWAASRPELLDEDAHCSGAREGRRAARTVKPVEQELWPVHLISAVTPAPAPPPEAPYLEIDAGGHTARVNQVLFTPDGKALVSAGNDKTIRLWDAARGEPERVLRGPVGAGPEGEIYAAALSPDGRTLAVGGFGLHGKREGHPITLYELPSGQITGVLRGHGNVITALAFSNEGLLASGSADQTVRLWDRASGRSVVLRGHENLVSGLAFSPTDAGKLASSSPDGTIRLWSVKDGKPLQVLSSQEPVHCLAWTPDGRTIAAGVGENITLWDVGKNRVRQTLSGHDGAIGCLAISRDGRSLVSGAGFTLHVWSLPEGKEERSFTGHRNTVLAAAFSPGDSVASADALGAIYLWSASTTEVRHALVGTGAVPWSVAWSPDGSRVAWGDTNRGGTNGAKAPLEFSFDLTRAEPGADAQAGEEWRRGEAEHAARTLAASPHEVIVREGAREVARFRQRDDIDDSIRCFSFTPSGEIVVGSQFGMALYDGSGRRLQQFVGHTGEVTAISVSPGGRYLASASSDQTVRIWRLRDRAPGQTAPPLLSLFTGSDREWIAWTPEGYYACSPAGDRMIGWQVNQGEEKAAAFYTAYQFRERWYRPDAVRLPLDAGGPGDAPRRPGSQQQPPPDSSMTAATIASFAPPRVDLSEPRGDRVLTDARVTVRVHVTDPNARKVTAVTILVNGRTRGLRVAESQGTNDWTQAATLVAGRNTISAMAMNDAGAWSAPVTTEVEYRPPGPAAGSPKPALYVLAIGVTEYQKSAYNLGYPAKDARDFVAAYQGQEGRLFGKVTAKILVNAEATRSGIEKGLSWLGEQATQRDYVIVFVCGHGETEKDQYFFVPYDGDGDRLASTGVGWKTFRDALGGLPATVLLVLDTCHAGGVAPGGESYSSILHDAITDQVGLITVASCLPSEEALESLQWENGAFTKALVEALKGTAADYDHDGEVILPEADLYIATRVKELTDGKQHTTVGRPTTIPSTLPLAVVP